MNPSKHKMTVLSQIFKLIPRNLIPKLAREYGVDKHARSFRPTSHVRALMFGQLSHASRNRNPVMAEKLFWSVLEHLEELSPEFRRRQT